MPTHPSHYEPAVTTAQAAAAATRFPPLNLAEEMSTVKDRYGYPLTKALNSLAGAEKLMDVPPNRHEYLHAVARELNRLFENGKPISEEKPTGPYAELKRVFDQAFTGQTQGKAKARHNKTGILPFEQQRIMTISETQNSPYGLTYQVTKKMLEALDMDEVEKTLHELQGVMVYVGALILYVERQELRRKAATMRPSDFGAIA